MLKEKEEKEPRICMVGQYLGQKDDLYSDVYFVSCCRALG